MPFFIKAFFKQLKKRLWAVPILVYPYLLMLKKKTMSAIIFKKLISKKPGKISKNLGLNANIAATLRQGAFALQGSQF